jgi:hypothetical protein
MRRPISKFILVSSLVLLVFTLTIWPLSYRWIVGHMWTTGSFLLEGKENVDSHFGVTASHGILRVEQFVTRVPAGGTVDDADATRLQTTRATAPLWFFVIFWGVVALIAWRVRRGMIRDN